uniref:Cytochrome P450 family protein n=1 Tax=Rhizophora mucronata TaxID=61149 RepID=A0A2P2NZ43_RHIMU
MLPELLLKLHRLHDWCTEVLEQTRCTFLFKGPWLASMDMLITVDPANIHHIMSSNFSNFPKGSEFKEIFEILGDGIFNADLELWKNQRKVAQSLITHRRFHEFLVRNSQCKVEKGLIPVLEHVAKQGSVLDLQDLFQRFTFDATCKMVTGHDPGCLSLEFPEIAFAKALDDAEEALLHRHVLPKTIWKLERWLGVGEEKKLIRAWETLDRAIAEIISAKKKELKRGAKLEEDGHLLAAYIREMDTFGSKSDDKFLRDIVVNFMIAGRDTTSSALTWFFWLLSKNPHVEIKIREELESTMPEAEAGKWRLFGNHEVKDLVYLHGALCEALRLYPPVPFQHKSPLKPDTLPSGHLVVPEMKVLFSLYAMGRMTSIWGDDCLEFKPERWTSERGRTKHEPSYRFLAFNAGPRTCLGKEVAFTQMKAVVAAIVHNYHVQVVDGHKVIPSVSIILQAKHGIKVKLAKRWA